MNTQAQIKQIREGLLVELKARLCALKIEALLNNKFPVVEAINLVTAEF
jgi:hypothetical protein